MQKGVANAPLGVELYGASGVGADHFALVALFFFPRKQRKQEGATASSFCGRRFLLNVLCACPVRLL